MDEATLSEPTGRASDVVAACEAAWRAFQRQHPELPHAVIVLGSGVERGRLVKLGHWWAGRWEAAGQTRGEVLLAGEALHLPVEEVFEVLLHEAAHGLNAARGIKDTSRGGRYHNARYRATAEEVGLVVHQAAPYGWARTTLTGTAVERYPAEITGLSEAMRIARRIEHRKTRTGHGPGTPGTDRDGAASGSVALTCSCGRRMRMAPSVAVQGSVWCGSCGTEFAAASATVGTSDRSTATGLLHPGVEGSNAADARAQAAAVAELRRPALHEDGLRYIARVAAWAEAHGQMLDEPMVAEMPGEVATLNRLARAYRQFAGYLTGPHLEVNGLLLARGDQVTVRADVDLPQGASPPTLPPAGSVGLVTSVDVNRHAVIIDFPIAGTYSLSADVASRTLTLGYAATPAARQAPLPYRQPEAALPGHVDPPLAEVIEPT